MGLPLPIRVVISHRLIRILYIIYLKPYILNIAQTSLKMSRVLSWVIIERIVGVIMVGQCHVFVFAHQQREIVVYTVCIALIPKVELNMRKLTFSHTNSK